MSSILNHVKLKVKDLLSPSIVLVKHMSVGTGDISYRINFKAHFLSAWIVISEPTTTQQHKGMCTWYYSVAAKEAKIFGATFKTKEEYSL